MVAFLVLAASERGHGAAIERVVRADWLALGVLVLAGACVAAR